MSAREPGKIVAGKFRLKHMLGRGGMGSVWQAEHLTLHTDVAVKFIDNEAAQRNANAMARFEQEATIAATLKSPHVVSVLDYGKDDEGRPYLAMELLKGEELGARLDRQKVLSLEDTKTIVVQVCKALHKAHAAGFVHRDLKPGNIFLVDEEEGFSVKILDFGLAKNTGSVGMTGVNELLGTPDFMSPEQARGDRDIDFRTDFYSLGVVAFQCLTGRMPYDQTASLPDLLNAITMREALLASTARPDLPAAVVSWLARSLKKDPKHRFESAKEMAASFADACAARRIVVSIPDADAGEARGEDQTISTVRGEDPTFNARKDADLDVGEDATVMAPPPGAESTVSAPAPPMVGPGDSAEWRVIEGNVAGPSRPKMSPPPPKGFGVDTTMPLGVDASAFEAARRTLPMPAPKALPESDRSPPSLPLSRSGLPPFWVIAIALLCITGAVYAILQLRR